LDTFSGQKLSTSTTVISWLLALIYLLAITGIELGLLLGINPGWGTLAYGLMLISLIIVAALAPENRLILIGFSGVPIIRIVTYGIPFNNVSLTAYLGVTGLVLLFYIIPTLRTPELGVSRIFPPPRKGLIQIFIILGGVAVGFCQFLVYPQKILYFSSSLELITFIAALSLLAFVEVVIFSGIALTGFTKAFSPGIGIVLAAFIYTSLFIPFGSVGLGLVMFLTSLFYGFATVRFSGIYGVIGAHFVSSLLYYLFLPSSGYL
jgi:membrane protease YdiL (CAAX protease family)